MSMDRDFVLRGLLCHSYLPNQRKNPEELPPVFTTELFTPEVAFELVKLKARKNGYDQLEYRLTRFNNVSRVLSIPHPLAHACLSICIFENWEELRYITKNQNSAIKPQQYSDCRLIIMNYESSFKRSNKQIGQSFGKRFRVHADIANFFSSIYSHAVPWALVGTAGAKAKKSDKKAWFNKLDRALRHTKREETQGIAIGPATSNIFSEAILARIDQKLCSLGFEFVRFIDDYTVHCQSEELAQDFIRLLSNELAKYKLSLNIKKTEIIKLPEPVSRDWIRGLSSRIPTGEPVSSSNAFHFLDYAVELAAKNPEDSVLKFALKALLSKKLEFWTDIDLLRYSLVLAYHQPALLPLIEKLIDSARLGSGSQTFYFEQVKERLNIILQENVKLHRSDGMCWTLYYIGKTNAVISENLAKEIVATRDALSILMLYWCGQYVELIIIFCGGLDKSDLYELDRFWILLYQLYYDGVIANPNTDGVFELLKANAVNFLRPLNDTESGDDNELLTGT